MLCILELGTNVALDWMWGLRKYRGGVGETQRDFDLSSREGSVQTERRYGVNPVQFWALATGYCKHPGDTECVVGTRVWS